MRQFIRQSVFFNALLAGAMLMVSCGDDDSPGDGDQTVEAKINSFAVVSPFEATGTINETSKTISVEVPGGVDLTAVQVEIGVPEGASVSPASGSTIDLTEPVPITVTGKNAAGTDVTQVYTVTTVSTASVAFVGNAATIEELEDDAQAAAMWTQATYGEDFVYLPAAQITPDALMNVKVIFYYELNAEADVDLGQMAGSGVATTISNFVRDGGQLLLAGDAAQYIFDIERVPDAYAFNEVISPGIEENKPADDFWGLSVVEGTTSANRTGHPLFAGLLNEENRLYLFNAPTREVRLVWWNVGPAGGECCGNVEMVTNFEEQLKATKLASLRHVGDYFGFAAVEFGRTDVDTHETFSPDITKDFRGTVLMLSNSIIGYEWVTNDGSLNEYHNNIEQLTENAINYLLSVYDETNQ